MMAQIIKWIFAGLLQTELSITPLIFIVLLIHKAAYKIKPRTWIWIWSALGIRLLCIIPIYFPAVGHTQSQNEIALSAYLGDTASSVTLPLQIPETSWINILFLLWLAGIILYYIRKYIQYISIKKNLLKNSKGSGNLMDWCYKLRIPITQKGYSRIAVRITSKNISPMLIGYRAKYLFLPSIKLSSEDERMIFLHEITHLKHKDLRKKFFITIICGLHWFNPAIYLFAKACQDEIEKDCDYENLKGKDKKYRKAYAEMLLFLIQSTQSTDVAVNLANQNNTKLIKDRFTAIMNLTKLKKGLVLMISIWVLMAGLQIPTQCQIQSVSFQNSFLHLQRMDGNMAQTKILDFKDLYYSRQKFGEALGKILPVSDQSSIPLKNGEFLILYATSDGKPFELKTGELAAIQFHLTNKTHLVTGLTNGTSGETTDSDPYVCFEQTTGSSSYVYIENTSSSTTIK